MLLPSLRKRSCSVDCCFRESDDRSCWRRSFIKKELLRRGLYQHPHAFPKAFMPSCLHAFLSMWIAARVFLNTCLAFSDQNEFILLLPDLSLFMHFAYTSPCVSKCAFMRSTQIAASIILHFRRLSSPGLSALKCWLIYKHAMFRASPCVSKCAFMPSCRCESLPSCQRTCPGE